VRVHHSSSEAETENIAESLGLTLQSGDVVLLSGALGAGKTAFVRGLARACGVDPSEVSSPTFTLMHEYAGRRRVLHHADLYRLAKSGAADLGLEEVGADGVVAIEWPDRLSHEIPGAVRVEITVEDDDRRRIAITGGRS